MFGGGRRRRTSEFFEYLFRTYGFNSHHAVLLWVLFCRLERVLLGFRVFSL